MPAAAVGLLLLGLGAGLIERAGERPTVRIAAGASTAGGGGADPVHGAPGHATRSPGMAASRPTRLTIPAAGVDATVQALGLNPDGTLEVPPADHADQVGWYRNGPTPGEVGPAVLVGHYDTVQGPAVFRRLPSIRPGDRIAVHRADRTTAVFRVRELRQFAKTGFPTDLVYGDTKGPELRLITCGGELGPGGHWTDNIIVFADLVTPPA